jgi:hypothetical protein
MRAVTRLTTIILALSGVVISSGCTRSNVGVSQPQAFLYRNTITPLTIARDRRNMNQSIEIPDNLIEGKATTYGINLNPPVVGLPIGGDTGPAFGNIGLERIFRESGMAKLSYADAHVISILGMFEKVTIHAYGPPKSTK